MLENPGRPAKFFILLALIQKMKKFVVMALLILLLPSFSYSYKYDLAVKWVKIDRNVVGEGELVKISAKVENNGMSYPFNIYFYIDKIDSAHLIGEKHYDLINEYRIPKIELDTKGYRGEHKIIAYLLDDENNSNNIGYCNLTILKTNYKRGLIIKEIYYHAHPNIKNEFIYIYNCGNKTSMDGMYLTTQPWKRADKQNKVFLPSIKIDKGKGIYITQNGSAFFRETGFYPDYEYYDYSSVPDLKRKGNFILSNKGSAVCLKDYFNHTIDCIVYGNASFNEGWNGKAIPDVGEGVILKRNGCIDTNTSFDWISNRIYKIGQSDFPAFHIKVKNAIAFCSPDCSYKVVSNTLNGKNISINVYMFTHPFIYKILNASNASIKIILDGNVIGGLPIEERYIAWKLHDKAEIRYIMGNENEEIYKRYKFDHAKYAIVDEKCIIESANWVETGLPVSSTYGNREWGVLIDDANLSSILQKIFSCDFCPEMPDSVPFNESNFFTGKPPPDFSLNYFVHKGNYKPKFSPFYENASFNTTLILAPDNAEEQICNLIDSAKNEILVEQAYIQKEWSNGINPFLKKLVEKRKDGVGIKVILNYNKYYESSNKMNEETYRYLKENGIEVKFSNLSVHNKGMIVDNKVLISSINWGENSVRNNREIGIIIEDKNISNYFRNIFYYDWNYGKLNNRQEKEIKDISVIILLIITAFIIYSYRRKK